MQPVDPSAENVTAMTNRAFILRLNRISASREVELFGRLHSDICNVPLYLLPGVRLQIRLTSSRPSFYLMNKSRFKDRFQIFGSPITGQMRQAEPRHYCLTLRH